MKLSPSAFTASRLPVRLVYSEYFDLVSDAIAAERKIKGWSRAKKEALIHGDWKSISDSVETPWWQGQRFILKDPSRLPRLKAGVAHQGEGSC